jgi:hypothetical protein
MIELGKLEPVDPRLVWKHEAHEFTPWLLGNADRLSEALGIELELEAAEHAVGGFSLDLFGRDLTNGVALMVENQLSQTDHQHLGQVLTYAAGTGASTIVWIATSFRPEHRQALDWLNESTDERTHFFGIELRVVQIGESARAPLFNVVAQPNDWQKQVRAAAQSGAVGKKGAHYLVFWERFIDRVHAERPDWTKAKAVGPHNWYEMRSPLKGVRFSFSFAQGDRLRHELYIDSGDGERNTAVYEYLKTLQTQIETAYGNPLVWEDLPTKKACRVAHYKDGCNIEQAERYDEFIDWFLDSSTRLRAALTGVTLPT